MLATHQIARPCEGAPKGDNVHGPSGTGQDGDSVASVRVHFSLPRKPLLGIRETSKYGPLHGVRGGNARPRFLVLAALRGVSGPGLRCAAVHLMGGGILAGQGSAGGCRRALGIAKPGLNGSFNFTKAVEEGNAENLLVIKDKGLTRLYMENWERHREHGEFY